MVAANANVLGINNGGTILYTCGTSLCTQAGVVARKGQVIGGQTRGWE